MFQCLVVKLIDYIIGVVVYETNKYKPSYWSSLVSLQMLVVKK